MSICVNCYHRIKHRNEIEVGHLWNNEPFLAVVCSDKCKECHKYNCKSTKKCKCKMNKKKKKALAGQMQQ